MGTDVSAFSQPCHPPTSPGTVRALSVRPYSLSTSTSAFNFFMPPTSPAKRLNLRIVATGSVFPVAATFSTIWRALRRRPFLPLILPMTK